MRFASSASCSLFIFSMRATLADAAKATCAAKNSTVTEPHPMPRTIGIAMQNTQSHKAFSEYGPERGLTAYADSEDEAACEVIMRRHNRLLFRTARSIGAANDIDMALENAFSLDSERCDRIVAWVPARVRSRWPVAMTLKDVGSA